MFRPNLIANYFIKKSLETGREVTPMKLIQLVYVSHGWFIGITWKELINEAVQAWKFGPVIPSVYNKFKIFGDQPITFIDDNDTQGWDTELNATVGLSDLSNIPEWIKEFLDKIWDSYGKFNGIQLSEMTHNPTTPWYRTWMQEKDKGKKSVIVPNNEIMQHYKDLLGKNDIARSRLVHAK